MRNAWPFSVNVLLFASGACLLPFFVLYYQSLGFTGTQIGLLTGLTPLVMLVGAPLWTNVGDATQRHRLLMTVAILGAAAAVLALPLFAAFVPVLLCVLLHYAFLAPVFAFNDSATMNMLGGQKALYGRIRLGGTFGFGIAAYLAGLLVERYDLRLTFWAGGALLLLSGLVSQNLRHHGPTKTSAAPTGRFITLLKDRRWLPLLPLAFAAGLAIPASTSYLFPYLQELGLPESTMGLALTLGTLAEVPVFFFGNRLIRRFTSFGLLLIATTISGLRLALFFVSPAPGYVLFLQFLSGFTFPAVWVAGVAYADEHAPPGLGATAQGLFGAMVFGFGAAVGGFMGGPLMERLGGRGTFLVYGVVILLIVAVVALLQKRVSTEQNRPLPGNI